MQGFTNVLAIDKDPSAVASYRRNFSSHNLLNEDISQLDSAKINKIIAGQQVDVIIGGPPCQ